MIIKEAPLDQTLIALADPTRRAILQQLVEGEARITEVAEPFDISLNSVSKHIRILERAKLIRRRKRGREHLISLSVDPLEEAVDWMKGLQSLWSSRLMRMEKLLNEKNGE